MSNYQFKGTLKIKRETIQVSEKYSKREFVLTDTSAQYPQDIQFQLSQDKCSLLDNFQLGQLVTVSFGLKGRSWTNPQGEVKFFNTIEAWKIESDQPVASPPQPSAPASAEKQDDDLPF